MVEQAFSPGISGTHPVFEQADHRHIYSGNIRVSEKGRGWRVEGDSGNIRVNEKGRGWRVEGGGEEGDERRKGTGDKEEKVGRREGRRRERMR